MSKMKKAILFLFLGAIFFSSCSVVGNSQAESTSIPAPVEPTPTPDPCAPENLVVEVEKVQDIVNAFQDIAYVANFTPQTELVRPIMEMQSVRRELQKLAVPPCEEALKSAAINYMNATINYLAFFMGGETQENVDAGVQNSQVLWQVVLGEFSKLLSSAGLIDEELPEISSALPTPTDSGIFVVNEGTQAVNVRGNPDLNSDIISRLEPGMQAVALSRTETNDWVLINLEGTIGWVSADLVVLTEPIEGLTVFE